MRSIYKKTCKPDKITPYPGVRTFLPVVRKPQWRGLCAFADRRARRHPASWAMDRYNDEAAEDNFTAEGAPAPPASAARNEALRSARIELILNARFDLGTLDMVRREAPAWWQSAENGEGRAVRASALRARHHLEAASEAALEAEFLAAAGRP